MKLKQCLALGLACILPISAAACQQGTGPSNESETAQEADPDAKPGISLSDGKLMLPLVSGRPGAAYFTLRNDGENPATLAGVYVDGADSAEMHETRGGTMAPVGNLEIAPGNELKFERGGLHVMAFGLSEDFAAGGSTEITLTFSDGDKLSAPLKIESTADSGSMPGMDHGDMH